MTTRLDRDVDPWSDAERAGMQLTLDRDPAAGKIQSARLTCAEYVVGHGMAGADLRDYLDALGIGAA